MFDLLGCWWIVELFDVRNADRTPNTKDRSLRTLRNPLARNDVAAGASGELLRTTDCRSVEPHVEHI